MPIFVCLWTEIPKLIQLALEQCRFELWGPLIYRFFSVDSLSLTDPHTVQTHIVQDSTGSWEPTYTEG